MIGLGSSIAKPGKIGKRIIRDGLVLKHDYNAGAVEPCSTGAVYLNGAGDDDYIDIGNQANLNMSTGSFSVSCWVYSNHHSTPTTRFVLGKGDNASTASSTGYALYLGNSGTDWIFSVGDGTDYKVSKTTVEANYNQWYHVCGTFDGTAKTLKLYIDGVLIDTDTDTDIGDIDNTTAFQIGRIAASTSNTWDGYICNVGVWKGVVLTQPQVKSIMHKDYASLSASEKTNLVSWWNLDSTFSNDIAVYDNHYGGSSELGSERLPEPSFTQDYDPIAESGTLSPGGWSINSNWVIANGVATALGTGSSSINKGGVVVATDADASIGKTGLWYRVSVDIVSLGVGSAFSFRIGSGHSSVGPHYRVFNTVGTHVFYLTPPVETGGIDNTTAFYMNPITSATGSFDNLSLKLVNGNTGTLS
tara:strand:+ start:297 stop:1544 length:1248 start_codon:yes stop_codon:yes gene_type:complete